MTAAAAGEREATMGARFAGWTAHGARARRIASRFIGDRSGGTAVQAIVMMPLIIFSTFGLIKAWEIIQVRESLHTGTYEATRYLSLYPPEAADPYYWAEVATRIIETELRNNPWIDPIVFIGDANNPRGLGVNVTFDGTEYACKMNFTIGADLAYRLANVAPFPGVQFTLQELREGEILCD